MQLADTADTIVAVSTPPGRSGIGVVRLSGPRAFEIVKACFRSKEPFQPRLARYGRLEFPDGRLLDTVLVTLFPAPRSYTGEDVAEIGAHGNPLILKDIECISTELGARRAAPGEFTFRAVAHGKMDLAQAEAVRDFVEAQTEAQAQLARLQMGGALARRLAPEREALIQAIAEVEAGIDFAEDDLEVPESARMARRLSAIAETLDQLAQSFHYGRLLIDGLAVAIVGKPNVGKSSLFNRLISQDRAIVTDLPGTTRDVLTEAVEIDGAPIQFADTAGVRDGSEDVIERIGVDRTLETLAGADLAVVVLDSSRELDAQDALVLGQVTARQHIIVVNKRDLRACWDEIEGESAVYVSARTGEGFDALKARIRQEVTERRPDTDGFFVTSERQRGALVKSIARLRAGVAALDRSVPEEMVLLDLYGALAELGQLTGEVVTEDILDRVFSTFCVGK